ncbi:MAG TPA: helix-turn-helix domain-containing protein [Thermoanaerobaculia bacterium]
MRTPTPSSESRTRPSERSFALQIGTRIKELRRALGWSQRDLAARANLDTTQLSKYESGTHKPPLGALIRMARAFGVLVDLLLPDVTESMDLLNARLLKHLRHLAGLGGAEKEIALALLDVVFALDRLRHANHQPPGREGAGPSTLL